jgi:perosamine synthetase
MKINHSKPYFTADDRESLLSVLKGNFVTNGPISKKLGETAASYMEKSYAVATQSGTDALASAFAVMNLPEGSEVVVPAYICSAPLDALFLCGLKPVPVDIDKNTLALSIDSVNLMSDVSAVLAAHLFGIPAPFYRLKCKKVVEDCAQTLGTEIDGYRVGSMGAYAVCSLYGTKLLTSGHGGIVAVNTRDLYDNLINLFQHDKQEEWQPHFHFQMSDLNASLGISQFAKLDFMIKRRRSIAGRFLEALGEVNYSENCIYSRFLVISDNNIEVALKEFTDAGIEAKRPVYKPLFHYLNRDPSDYPSAQWAHDNIISVPLYPAMSEEEIVYITNFLEKHKDELCCWPSA